MANQFRFNNFVNDVEKLLDMITLNKEEFLKSYSYLTPEEYDNTVAKIGPVGSYKFIDAILNAMRRENEVMLRLAIVHLTAVGADSLKKVSYDEIRGNIKGNALMTDKFAEEIVIYAKHLSRLPVCDMYVWMSRNLEYDVGDNKPSYKRLEKIAEEAVRLSVSDPVCNNMVSETLEHLRYNIELTDDEIEYFGYGYVLDCDEDEADEDDDER